ncbi:MAG: hypothetical protein LBV28_02515, partial [Puniceicoccales bacterium]|nr:hypothetical protein [Puniceicoccales bacterium]
PAQPEPAPVPPPAAIPSPFPPLPPVLKRPPIKRYIVKAKPKPLPVERKPREIARSDNWNRERLLRDAWHKQSVH